jgi:Fumarylacetoacetate (FAA) hydrolase family
MIFDVRAIIEFLSGSTTLLPGTTILTGTPQGIGMAAIPPWWLKPGDSVTIEIEKIGQLTNPVQSEGGLSACYGSDASGELSHHSGYGSFRLSEAKCCWCTQHKIQRGPEHEVLTNDELRVDGPAADGCV